MRIKRLRLEAEVLNKLDGKMYKVVNKESGLAKEICEDGTLGEKEVQITEQNALAFRIVNDPAPYPIEEGYTVSEHGILLKDGDPVCDQGEIKIKSIVASQPGYLILTTKQERYTDEDLVELVSYQPSRDRFRKLGIMTEPALIGYVGENREKAVIAYSRTVNKKMEDENGIQRDVRVFDSAKILSIAYGSVKEEYTLSAPITVKDILFKEIPTKSGDTCESFNVFLPLDEGVDEHHVVTELKKRVWIRTDCDLFDEVIPIEGEIRADWSYAYNDFVVRNDHELYIPCKHFKIDSPAVAELDGYDILIDVTCQDDVYKLTFSDHNYGFKVLTSKRTKDRGYIVTVE